MGKRNGNGINLNSIEDVNKLISRLVREMAINEQDNEGMPDGGNGIYGFNVRIDRNGISVIEDRRGPNVRQNAKVRQPEQREPLIDVIDRKDCVVVIAEMPGLSAKEIRISTDGSTLNINASSLRRSYSKNIHLPSMTNPASSEARYNNGVLEVSVRKGYYNGKDAIIDVIN